MQQTVIVVFQSELELSKLFIALCLANLSFILKYVDITYHIININAQINSHHLIYIIFVKIQYGKLKCNDWQNATYYLAGSANKYLKLIDQCYNYIFWHYQYNNDQCFVCYITKQN